MDPIKLKNALIKHIKSCTTRSAKVHCETPFINGGVVMIDSKKVMLTEASMNLYLEKGCLKELSYASVNDVVEAELKSQLKGAFHATLSMQVAEHHHRPHPASEANVDLIAKSELDERKAPGTTVYIKKPYTLLEIRVAVAQDKEWVAPPPAHVAVAADDQVPGRLRAIHDRARGTFNQLRIRNMDQTNYSEPSMYEEATEAGS